MDRRGVAVGTAGQKVRRRSLTNLLQATGMWICRSNAVFACRDSCSVAEGKRHSKTRQRRLCHIAQATACQRKTRLPFAPNPTVSKKAVEVGTDASTLRTRRDRSTRGYRKV